MEAIFERISNGLNLLLCGAGSDKILVQQCGKFGQLIIDPPSPKAMADKLVIIDNWLRMIKKIMPNGATRKIFYSMGNKKLPILQTFVRGIIKLNSISPCSFLLIMGFKCD